MDRIRMTDPESPYYRQAMELYAAGFPLHEQRRPEEQIQAMKDPAFHCDALVESGTFIGLLFYWEAVGVTYVEYFAVVEALRSSGAGSRALAAFCPAHAPVVLEIDPPEDAVSTRRKGFYQRLGFAENSYAHRRPPYRTGFAPHPLVVMSWPEALSPEAYSTFSRMLSHRVMRYAQVGISQLAVT
ncbi:GNAT family N-acetyltransferase [Intestinimonas butyriciproducens]|uniref:GNAT family N-acetyltransferase n=1 Tax=Intestinimonas butyriciproducens TaxID=1297617 RepID=UPI0034A5839A